MPRKLRILLLLIVLAPLVWFFRIGTDPVPDWQQPLRVAVYPYNVDASAAVDAYLAGFGQADLDLIGDYFADQADRYHLPLQRPFEFVIGQRIANAPPMPPREQAWLGQLQWALSLRLWRMRFDDQGLAPDIVTVARFNAVTEVPPSHHSIGIAELRLAIANLPAVETHRGYGRVLLAHEILHTVGAQDLYHPATGLPVFPAGYAEPNRDPRYPQSEAELMAGRIPVEPGRAVQAMALDQTRIGPRTAREIGWLQN